ncbi:MAG: glycoside hydrolase family 2 TIM barrel-domain containing protein, partial [Verrucomicrobiota bacterium]|nr:glycoside hydrolase family 2 TIM barrel-domain containing protein [Verrucomicrobiota bacterium]
LTDHLKVGENVLAVRLDNKPKSSRWYPGGGIYRNVRLVKTAQTHVAHWGICVTTPEITTERATVKVLASIEGAFDRVEHEIVETGARAVGTNCTLAVVSPKLWDLKMPNLYTLKTSVLKGGDVVDEVETRFGIRSIQYTPDGFFLNGKRTRMNGVCQHHDLGPLGAAINTRALERQIEILQEMGCNAIRTSHNPPAPELLDLCDRMGMLVQVEAFDCWALGKNKNDYHRWFQEWHERDLTAMVHRDRNHPSVIMWSSGNEVKEQRDDKEKLNLALSRHLTDTIGREDPVRPVSVGCNNVVAGFNGFAETLDVFGYNYKPQNYAKFRKEKPDIPLYGAETASCISSRGEYFFPVIDDKGKGCGGDFQVSSYDLFAPPWADKPDVEFAAQDRHPEVMGEFVWTGFDYLGEPTPYNKDKTNLLNFNDPEERKRAAEELERMGGTPSRSSYFGIMDLCGFKKDRFYIYQARWRPELPMAHILPHWNWPERVGEITPVHVYTSGDEAELFLNGKSLGRKEKGKYQYRLRWDDVVYQPGELKVVAYKNGKKWVEGEMKTTGAASQVSLTADRPSIAADGSDLSFITVQVSDKEGLMVPRSDHLIRFRISGPGEVIAVGSGNPVSHESFQALERKVFNGLCLV